MSERRIAWRLPALAALAGWLALGSPGEVAAQGAQRPARATGAPFAGFGSNSKEPVKVDAARLEVFDKENRVVYSGDVVAVQGQTTMRCSVMTIYYTTNRDQRAGATPPAARPAATAAATGQSSIRQIDCKGPVSLLSGTQSATSNHLLYDAEKDTVTLTGKVVMADCDNVQRGERAVYDVKTGRGTVDAGATGRVQGVFTPGGDEKKRPSDARECGSPAPAAAASAPQSAAPARAPLPIRP